MIRLRGVEKSYAHGGGRTWVLRRLGMHDADEPTGNLHSEQGREIMDLFRSLNSGGTTIVQVTHSDTNAACGARVVRLEDGWIAREPRAAQAG